MHRYYLLQYVLDNRTRRGHTPTTPHSRSIDLNLTYPVSRVSTSRHIKAITQMS